METFFVFKVSSVFLHLIMREKILNKSAELFLTYGFKSVTMDDIANEMGISKKTIYQHFDNKTNLLKQLHYHYLILFLKVLTVFVARKKPY